MSPDLLSSLPVELSRGLAARLRDAAAAADRLADFTFVEGDGGPPCALAGGDEDVVAADFVRRAIHAASDPLNARILRAASDGPVTIDQLEILLGLPRLAALERVHELIQVGLVARDLPQDTVLTTGAGAALDAVFAEIAVDVAGWLRSRRVTP